MIERGSATEDEVICAFLRAEIDSSRYSRVVKDHLAAFDRNRSLIDAPDLTDPAENTLRRRLLDYRGYERRESLFTGFPREVAWRRVDLDASDLQTMRYINEANWNELSSGTRLVSEGARNLPRFASDKRFQHIVFMAHDIRGGKRFEPLVAARHNGGQLVLVEGHSRATAYSSEHFGGPINTLIGSSASMDKWAFY